MDFRPDARRQARQAAARARRCRVDAAGYRRVGLGALACGSQEASGAVRATGRVVGVRKFGRSAFVEISDGVDQVQVLVEDRTLPLCRDFRGECDPGDLIEVYGTLGLTRSGARALMADEFSLLAKHLPQFSKALADASERRAHRFHDLFVNRRSRLCLELVSDLAREIRTDLWASGFREFTTPTLSTRFNGGLSRPFQTKVRALGSVGYLRVTSEIYLKQLIAAGFESVFEIGSQFRNEGMDHRHIPEFQMLEVYRAQADAEEMAELTVSLLNRVTSRLKSAGRIYSDRIPALPGSGGWKRVDARAAVRASAGIDILESDLDSLAARAGAAGVSCSRETGYAGIVAKLIDHFVRSEAASPTILGGLPSGMTPLMKRRRGAPELADRVWLYAGRVDICDIGSEQADYEEQAQALEVQRASLREVEPIKRDRTILDVTSFGLPPTGGVGMGLGRLAMMLLGSDDIEETVAFPLR